MDQFFERHVSQQTEAIAKRNRPIAIKVIQSITNNLTKQKARPRCFHWCIL